MRSSNQLRLLRIVAVLGATLALAVAEPIAFAQDASARAEGRALFAEGVKLLKQGRAAEACPALEASLRRLPGIGTRGKLAECYEALGHTASAWSMYKDVAVLAGKAGDNARARVAAARAAALEPKLSHLTVVAPAPVLPGLTVKRDGVPVEQAIFGVPTAVDPGVSTFEISAPGRLTRTVSATIEPGKALKFTIPPLTPAPTAAGHPKAAGHAEAQSGASPPASDASEWSPQRQAGLALGIVGVAALAVGGGLGLSAKVSYDDAFSRGLCDRSTKQCVLEGKDQTDAARTKAVVATGVVAAGAAVAGAGIVLFLVAPKGHESDLVLAPTVGFGGAGATLSGRF
jgi:hypothetical protein